ncbi:MAG: transcriptional repressor LexA, partial [Lysobacterales bacterium]
MQALTDRQQAVFDFIRDHIDSTGMAPTLAEIAQAFGLAQACGALKHVRRLAAAGYLELIPNRARGIRLAPALRKPLRAAADPDHLALPLVGQVAAGLPILNEASIERTVIVDRWLFRPRPHYLLRVSGTSMVDAGILDGDLIAVQRSA